MVLPPVEEYAQERLMGYIGERLRHFFDVEHSGPFGHRLTLHRVEEQYHIQGPVLRELEIRGHRNVYLGSVSFEEHLTYDLHRLQEIVPHMEREFPENNITALLEKYRQEYHS